jgi:hypothetical protein
MHPLYLRLGCNSHPHLLFQLVFLLQMFPISNNHPLRASIRPDHLLTPLTIANMTESMTESSDLVLTTCKLSMAIVAREGGAGIQMLKGEVDEEGVEDEVTVKTLVPAAILGGLVAPEMKVKEEAQIGETKI